MATTNRCASARQALTVLMATIWTVLFTCSYAQAANGDRLDTEARFEIPAQPLSTALVQFSRQAELQLVTASIELGTKETQGISGRLSLRKALEQLLKQSGLSYSLVGENTIAIAVTETDKQRASGANGAGDAGVARRDIAIMMARADTTTVPTASRDAAKSAQPSPENALSDEEESAKAKGIPQILVRGSRDHTRSLNVDLPRSEDDAKPYYIFSRDTIQTSGAGTVQDFLFQRLPMNAGSMPLSQHLPTNVGAGLATVSMVDLRGLGTDQTLILINGRRLSTVSIRGVDRQPDLNGLPLSAVDRIEVLPSSASGIYGGGAVGGVINIILRRDYAGSEVKVNYANTFDSNTARVRYEATSGFSLEQGRTNVLLSATYSDTNPLLRGDRFDLFAEGRDRYLASNPASPTRPPLGSTTNIYSYDGSDLTLKNGGGALNSPLTHLPVGYSGVDSDNGATLIANAGGYNNEYADLPYIGLQQPTNSAMRTRALQFNVRREMNNRLELFLDSSYSANVTPMKRGALLSSGIRVPASAAANPFEQEVRVNFPAAPAAPMDAESEVLRGSLGFILKLPRSWQLQGDYSASEGDNFFSLGSAYGPAMEAAVVAGTLNPFVDTQLYPIDLTPYLVRYVGDYHSSLREMTVRTAGPIWRLPGGEVNLAANIGSRVQRQIPSTESFISTPAPESNSVNYYLGQRQRTDNAYVELTIPFFGRDNALPGLALLDLQLAARHEIYRVNAKRTATGGRNYSSTQPTPEITTGSTRYDSTNPTIGLRYRPVTDVMFRVSYSTAFRPPLYYQLQPGVQSANPSNIIDPLRDGESVSVYTVSGGNPDITPEEGKNWNAGIVFTPHLLPGLRLGIDYVRIEKTNNIASLGAQVLVDNESTYSSRITRATPAPGDPFGIGEITGVDASYLNLYGSRVESVDLSASYLLDTARAGSFSFSTIATRNLHYIQQLSMTIPEREFVDFPARSGGSVKFKGNATVTWNRGPWTASWTAFFYSDYAQYGPPFTSSMAYLNAQGGPGARIPRQHFHDVFVGYSFGEAGAGSRLWQKVLDRTEVQAGVKNLFNKAGAFDAYFSFNGYRSPFGKLELSTYWLSLKKGL